METITKSCICLGSQVRSKDEAIRLAGQMLVAAGYIGAPYVDSLFKREAVSNTLLGSGVAIPHGMVEDRHYIHATGIAVVQVPQGVEWKDGQRAHLIVAIAAQSDEHIAVLRRLTRLMQQEGAIDALVRTRSADEIIAALTGTAAPTLAATAPAAAPECEVTWQLDYPNGLHARPATRWVEVAKRHAGEVCVIKGGEIADAKSLTALLGLGVVAGDTLRLGASGADARRAVEALLTAVQSLSADEKADAERARLAAEAARKQGALWQAGAEAKRLRGIPASPGLAIGRIVRHVTQTLVAADTPGQAIDDGAALEQALEAVKAELSALEADAAKRLGAGEAAIFAAQRELIADVGMLRAAIGEIMRGHGAAWAWQKVLHAQVERQRSLADPLLAARALDLRDAGERVLARLLGVARQSLTLTEPSIVVAEDLTPSDTLQLDMRYVVGLAISSGGPTSHTAILARTLGLPALVAAGEALLSVATGTQAVMDGSGGALYLDCTEDDLVSARVTIARLAAQRAEMETQRYAHATTTDGHTVEVLANITNARQAAAAVEAGAEGVGLMRTEFLFLERDRAPSEDEQFEVYKATLEALGGRPLVIRTLDIGGDKQVAYLDLPKEENPFLGVRGARLLLARPELLRTQLRALYRAAAHGPLSIMFPMITELAEVTALRTECEAVRQALYAPAVPLGIMVEVPAVAVMADQFAAAVDFFSIGTNDLTQYVLAMDRQHPQLAAQADSLSPAVLALIANTARAANAAGVHVGVCGGLAGDPLGARILAGLGVNALSMSAQDVVAVKDVLRRSSMADLKTLAVRALAARSAAEVRAL